MDLEKIHQPQSPGSMDTLDAVEVDPIWLEEESDNTQETKLEELTEKDLHSDEPLENMSPKDIAAHVDDVFQEIYMTDDDTKKAEPLLPAPPRQKAKEHTLDDFDITDVAPVPSINTPISNDSFFDETRVSSNPLPQFKAEATGPAFDDTAEPLPVKEPEPNKFTNGAESEFIDPSSPEYQALLKGIDKLPPIMIVDNNTYKTIDGTYHSPTREKVGEGGMGFVEVLEKLDENGEPIKDHTDHKVLAILKRPNHISEKIIKAFEEEARILSRLEEQGIEGVSRLHGFRKGFDTVTGDRSLEMIMTHDGIDLEDTLEAQRNIFYSEFLADVINNHISPERSLALDLYWSQDDFNFAELFAKVKRLPKEKQVKALIMLFTNVKHGDDGTISRPAIMDNIDILLQSLDEEGQKKFIDMKLRLSEESLARYLPTYRTLDSIAQLDQLIIHRDVKPANILTKTETNPQTGEEFERGTLIDPGVAFEMPKGFNREDFKSRTEQLQAIQNEIDANPEGKLAKYVEMALTGTMRYMYPTLTDSSGSKLQILDNKILTAEADRRATAICQVDTNFEETYDLPFPAMSPAIFKELEIYSPEYYETVAQLVSEIMILDNDGNEVRYTPPELDRILFIGKPQLEGLYSEQREKVAPTGEELGIALTNMPKRVREYNVHKLENDRRIRDGIRNASNQQFVLAEIKRRQEENIPYTVFDFPELVKKS